MRRARIAGRGLALLVCASVSAFAAPSPTLAPYASYARGPGREALLDVAREALCVAGGRCDSLRVQAPDWPGAPRPVFVTLAHGGATRACLGRDEPAGSLTATVRAISGELLVADRRRPPVPVEELESLQLTIAFVGDERPLADPYAIDPMREGLRVETERGAVAFLPGEARTVAWALGEARRIGVLRSLADARFTRFSVVVVSGPAVVPTVRSVPPPHVEVHP